MLLFLLGVQQDHDNDADEVDDEGNDSEGVPLAADGVLLLTDHHGAGSLVQQGLVEVQAAADGHAEGAGGQGLGDAQGQHDGEHDNADGDDSAGAIGGGEDQSGNSAQQDAGDTGLIAAQLDSVTDDGAGDAGLDQDAAEPGAEDDVDSGWAEAGGTAVQNGGVDVIPGDDAADGADGSPQQSHDEQTQHQVAAADGINHECHEGNQDNNTKYSFHIDCFPPQFNSRRPQHCCRRKPMFFLFLYKNRKGHALLPPGPHRARI